MRLLTRWSFGIPAGVLAWSLAGAQPAPPVPEPTRIVIECEDMRGVDQAHFGPGKGWQVGRWGHDLYQNMTFGGTWASRLRTAMTDASANPAEMSGEFEIPASGTYRVWVKYECPPFFNYAFDVKIEPVTGKGRPVFDKLYGLRESAKHFSFRKELLKGDLYWNWGIDHDAAEGYNATLPKGRYRITISKAEGPEPKGARSLDAILITSDLSEISAPRYPRYPLLDELRRENHVYFRFRNPKNASNPIFITWDHWNHRPEYVYYVPDKDRQLVKFYDEGGRQLVGGKDGNWSEGISAGAASPWFDLGPTMNVESTSPFHIIAHSPGAKPTDASAPFSVDIALKPNKKSIVKSFALQAHEPALSFLVQPDLYRPEGVATTRKVRDIYRELTDALEARGRLGPLPKRLRIFGSTGFLYPSVFPAYFRQGEDERMAFREALGLNTFSVNADTNLVSRMLAWGKAHSGIVERSLAMHHMTDMGTVVANVRAGWTQKEFYYVSFGDEIGLPDVDVKNGGKVEAFREFLRKRGETPQSLGLGTWDRVKPLPALSSAAAVQIGVLPEKEKGDEPSVGRLKKLYWYSSVFRAEQGIAAFAEKTLTLETDLGKESHTSANLGSMMPFYWMQQASFIEAFKHHAMSLAWSEDYTYAQPEGSRLVADFETAYLRKGASYHDTPMQFFCMPHWPGNNPEQLLQNAVLEWGQNVKDLDFFNPDPDIWQTENYIAYRGGLPMFRAIRTLSGMAGLIEDHLLPARTNAAAVAILLSEASDVWETEGKGQGVIEPGHGPSNVSQEERKAIWYALRSAGYRVDFLTENDCADGLLKNYSALYVSGENLERKAAVSIRDWVKVGGTVFATAGAARKDEFDAPLTELDEMFGRGKSVAYDRYKGPLRARMELLFAKPLDELKLADGKSFPAYCSREQFSPASNAHVLGTYQDGRPGLLANEYGQGHAYYTGTLPGQAYLRAALPVVPQGKGGPADKSWMTEWLDRDAVAADVILLPLRRGKIVPDVTPNHRGVITNRLESERSTVITVVNLALQVDGELKGLQLRVGVTRPVKRAWSCFYSRGSLVARVEKGAVVLNLPRLGPADVIVLEH